MRSFGQRIQHRGHGETPDEKWWQERWISLQHRGHRETANEEWRQEKQIPRFARNDKRGRGAPFPSGPRFFRRGLRAGALLQDEWRQRSLVEIKTVEGIAGGGAVTLAERRQAEAFLDKLEDGP
jgi:hypothetical protein